MSCKQMTHYQLILVFVKKLLLCSSEMVMHNSEQEEKY